MTYYQTSDTTLEANLVPNYQPFNGVAYFGRKCSNCRQFYEDNVLDLIYCKRCGAKFKTLEYAEYTVLNS